MKACVSVDYLSHEWSCTDLIQAHRELQRQKSKNAFNLTTKEFTATPKELKRLSIEKVRQIRYQNAIWRQMARSCTKKLSYSNQMIHPSSVNWQKESDVTWLYGPLYMPPESSSDLITHPSLSFLSPNQQKNTATSDICYTIDSKNKNPTPKKLPLKPVLKKNIPSTSNVMLQREYWIRNDRYWSKCASDSGKQSVRFNPNITEVNFLPETPVKESFSNSKKRNEHSSYFSLDSEGEEEDEDDEELWDVIVQVGSYFKSVLFTSLFKSKTTHKPNANTLATPNQQVIKSSNSNLFNFDLIQFCVSSAVSFTAWIMYQTFSTVIKHTPFAPASTTNHIKTQRRAVTKPASQQLLHRKNKGTLVV